MIITSKLAWYHLPKTAGTTTDQLFLASGLPLLWHDDQNSPKKHLSPSIHPCLDVARLQGTKPIVNIRRLPYWLLSNYQHKIQKMDLDVCFDSVRHGLFWRHRDQEWLPADWWLERFEVDHNWSFLRVEYLKHDFLRCLNQYEPISTISRLRVGLVGVRNRNNYDKDLSQWFSSEDLLKIYQSNPIWSSIELNLYGSLLCDAL